VEEPLDQEEEAREVGLGIVEHEGLPDRFLGKMRLERCPELAGRQLVEAVDLGPEAPEEPSGREGE